MRSSQPPPSQWILRCFPLDSSLNLGIVLLFALTSETGFPGAAVHAATGAILATFLVGHSLRITFASRAQFEPVSLNVRLAFDVALSFVFMVISSSVLAVFYLLNAVSVSLILCSVITGANLLQLVRGPRFQSQRLVGVDILPIIPVVALGLFLAIMFRWSFVWPSMPGWDTYAHLADVNSIVAKHGLPTIFPTSSTFQLPYPYLFHVLVASFSELTGIAPYTIFWLGPYFSIPLYGVLVYFMASVLTENKSQAVIAALLATSVSGGETLLGPQYFFPSTVFILVLVLCFIAIARSPLRGIWQSTFTLAALVSCYLLYYYPLPLTLPPLVLILINRNPKSFLARNRWVALIVAFATTISLTYVGSAFLGTGSISFPLKVTILNNAYPAVLWILIAVGGLIIVHKFLANHNSYFSSFGILTYVALMVALFFLPFPGSIRSELLLRPFAAVVASYSVIAVVRLLTSIKGGQVRPCEFPGYVLRIAKACALASLVLSAVLLVQPYLGYSQKVNAYSNISSDEYQAAQWLLQNTPVNRYILSDPSTGFLFRGLTLLNCSTSFTIRGQALAPGGDFRLTSLIYDFFTTKNLTQANTVLNELPQMPQYVVITTRTAGWASWGGINSTFPAPSSVSPLDSFAGFQKFSSPLFTLAVSWATVRIYIPELPSQNP